MILFHKKLRRPSGLKDDRAIGVPCRMGHNPRISYVFPFFSTNWTFPGRVRCDMNHSGNLLGFEIKVTLNNPPDPEPDNIAKNQSGAVVFHNFDLKLGGDAQYDKWRMFYRSNEGKLEAVGQWFAPLVVVSISAAFCCSSLS